MTGLEREQRAARRSGAAGDHLFGSFDVKRFYAGLVESLAAREL